MASIFLFHGIDGSSKENWLPWLKAELEKAGHRAIVPDFPHAALPDLDAWLKHMEKYEDSIDDQTIFVGHSLGATLALRILETRTMPIQATFLIASVTGPRDGLAYAPLMTSFTTPSFDYETIKKNGGALHMIHADNDPYVLLVNAQTLSRNLGADLEVIQGGGHLNASAGYTEFPALRDEILLALS